jgi:hypothetical protein
VSTAGLLRTDPVAFSYESRFKQRADNLVLFCELSFAGVAYRIRLKLLLAI